MPQKTNLNVNPYYDDFDKDDNFYKVLFKPGYPVQARELTGLQSILQNQIESFGSHIFKEGSMVIPGGITCDNNFATLKVNSDHLGVDVTLYLDSLVNANEGRGTEVKGQESEVFATIKDYLLPPEEGVENITLIVKYSTGGSDNEAAVFSDGEDLILQENVTYGNTTLNSGDTAFTVFPFEASNVGYAVGVAKGVYFIRGTFVDIPTSQIILDPYNSEPSYRVGFDVIEEIISADDDQSLNDNAKGFTNYAAPGADRLKISVRLSKKQLTDFDDTNFIELVKIDNGVIRKLQNKSDYSIIKDYFAKRTYEESGDYSVDPFTVDTLECLNNETGNGGLYLENQKTEQGNTPSEDLMCVRLSAGTAYVRGFDINLVGSTVLDVEKPRTTKSVPTARIPFAMGSLLKVNNVFGAPIIGVNNTNTIGLFNSRRDGQGTGGTVNAGSGTRIGDARVYWFGVSDAPYGGNATEWDLYLYDIQTYTQVILHRGLTAAQAPVGSYVRGLSSGATGYVAVRTSNTQYQLSQTSGTFVVGEEVTVNESESIKVGLTSIDEFTVEDIKSVWQDSSSLDATVNVDFLADTVLHEKRLPSFSIADKLNINGTTGRVAGRFFSGVTGIKENAIIKYQTAGQTNPNYNVITAISADGTNITLSAAPSDVTGVCRSNIDAGDSTFSLMVPKILNLGSSGLFAELPEINIASVNLNDSELTITRQLTGQSTNAAGSLTIQASTAFDVNSGITSVFFEPFDAERYSIVYSNGSIEDLTSGQVTLSANSDEITFTNLTANQNNVVVNLTLRKIGFSSKSKDFIRSEQVHITRTSGVSTATALTTSNVYGIRVEDDEICLNFSDVAKVRAIYESTNNASPVLDRLTFSTGLGLDNSVIIGEKIIGANTRAIGQIVSATPTTIDYIPLNDEDFEVGEVVNFKESSISQTIQDITPGSYIDKTSNYILNRGQKKQYSDYSKITRKPGGSIPSRRLLIIFDRYGVAAGNQGDVFTVNSYTKERFKSDIASINGSRLTDLIDFRPKVSEFNPDTATGSPFSFENRTFESTPSYVISPDESSTVGYSYYLPRVDLLTINKLGEVEVVKGDPSDLPQAPILADDAMEIARIILPAYLYNTTQEPIVRLQDNRRFTMRDIAKLEERIENLEEVTSLTMLELNAKTTQVTDANGLDRFKSGFVVSDFRDKTLFERGLSSVDIHKSQALAISPVDFWSIPAELALDSGIDRETADLSQNLRLLDPNIQKTGDLLTLKYTQVGWIEQPHATETENVNPFNVIVFVGGVIMDPPSDNWTRTIYVNDSRVESSGARWVQEATSTQKIDVDVDVKVNANTDIIKKVDYVTYKKGGGRGERIKKAIVSYAAKTDVNAATTTTTTTTTTTSYKPKLEGPSKEFSYIESVHLSNSVDPFMRSRNVYFAANGLKPYVKHYHYIDNQQVDLVPKLCEISMNSGTFRPTEDVDVFAKNGKKIARLKLKAPNHKFGDTSSPDIGAGLGSPSVLVEKYTVDPFNLNRPAPPSTYSATSKLINFDVRSVANKEKYYGYVTKGAKIVGRTSGAIATISDTSLISDNWGDIIACFFFRDPNTSPPPPVKVKSGTKTIKVTANAPSSLSLPSSSEAIGDYSGTGTVLTQKTTEVSLRNPPKPKTKPTQVKVEVKATHRDPLAQSFTVDGKGVYLTSFDLFFARKDPKAKIFIELRTVELGTPTDILVQDYAQIALNPNNISVSNDGTSATNVKFKSPVYLQGGGKEYAIVILSPASDKYEMWVSTMGQKTVKTSSLPDVQNVIVSKQYIGGSLFKSQNGTIWTPSQFQDLTFKLYKAQFVSSGTLTFYNEDVTAGGTNVSRLRNNPLRGLPRKLLVPFTGALNAAVVTGTKVGESSSSITGTVENIGGTINTETIISAGIGYSAGSYSNVNLFSLTGSGSGAVANVTVTGDAVTAVTITNAGSNYVEGEILGITTANVGGGAGAKIGVQSLATTHSLFLTNVQGENFTNTSDIEFYTDINDETTRTDSGADVNGNSTVIAPQFNGNVFTIRQFNHAHHGANNTIKIVDVQPDREKVKLTANFGLNDSVVSVANTTVFATFEGITTTRGYAQIGPEIIEYSNITAGGGGAGTLSIANRSQNDSVAIPHSTGDSIRPYEVNGVSLMRINTTHSIPANYYRTQNSNIDNYFLEFDRSSQNNRSSGDTMLNWNAKKGFGGKTVGISQNHQFSSFQADFNIITPGKGTSATAQLRTISGTSAGGTEVSFLDQGYASIPLNRIAFYRTPRMVASRINELARLSTMPLNKSLTMRVDFKSNNPDLSPAMDIANAIFTLGRNKVNNPISDYVVDNRANRIEGDPHASVFVTKVISLDQPATSLRVLIGAQRPEGADFRVLYRLFRADSSEVPQNYTPFPGWDNLQDTDGDGFGDRVIDSNKNSGRADAFVSADSEDQFSEYQFTADNLPQFLGFSIKVVTSSTNESTPVKLKDFRCIALA